jgi:hypothetical protein
MDISMRVNPSRTRFDRFELDVEAGKPFRDGRLEVRT